MKKVFEPVTVKKGEAIEKQIQVIGQQTQAIRDFNHASEDQT